MVLLIKNSSSMQNCRDSKTEGSRALSVQIVGCIFHRKKGKREEGRPHDMVDGLMARGKVSNSEIWMTAGMSDDIWVGCGRVHVRLCQQNYSPSPFLSHKNYSYS